MSDDIAPCRVCGLHRGSVWVEGVCSVCRDASHNLSAAQDGPSFNWLPIDLAEQHVKDAAAAITGPLGRSRAVIYHGPGRSLYAFWCPFSGGKPPTLWCRLPDYET